MQRPGLTTWFCAGVCTYAIVSARFGDTPGWVAAPGTIGLAYVLLAWLRRWPVVMRWRLRNRTISATVAADGGPGPVWVRAGTAVAGKTFHVVTDDGKHVHIDPAGLIVLPPSEPTTGNSDVDLSIHPGDRVKIAAQLTPAGDGGNRLNARPEVNGVVWLWRSSSAPTR